MVTSVILVAVLLATSGPLPALATANVGYRDFSYSTKTTAPTGDKPQSKLWHNDGTWWGSLFTASVGAYRIYRLNRSTQRWIDTGTTIDTRNTSRADTLWDGTHLYVATATPSTSATDQGVKVLRFSYNSTRKSYRLDAGFPVVVFNKAIEAVVLDKDTTGALWVTYTYNNGSGGRKLFVTHTTTGDTKWVTPFTPRVTGATNLTADDISAVVAFRSQIGVMWSNQNAGTMYFITHKDGDPDRTWTQNPALQGPKYADDHINLKSLQADASGQVFAAVKTSLGDNQPPSPNAPQILLLTLGNTGSWSRRTFGKVQDGHTRPIVMIDDEHRIVYMFATAPEAGGAIYYKSASLDNIKFPSGRGTPFIDSTSDLRVNNATSTKQNVNSTTGLVMVASDDSTRYYLHNYMSLASVDTR